MIKKLQQLKAKKGFTLVELIVVIAIIGVLAAILVPTMMGFVTSSRVTSANSTAASFQDQIEQFLTDCDTKGYGMLQANTSTSEIEIKITSGKWKTTVTNAASFKDSGSIKWTTAAADMSAGDASSTAIVQANAPVNLLSIKLMTLFPDIQNGYVKAYAKAGHVEAVVYTADASDGSKLGDICGATYDTNGALKSTAAVNWTTKVAKWDEKTAGISSAGLTVGTAPALALGNPGQATT